MRLVPAALTAWAVTVAGIAWQIGYFVAVALAVTALILLLTPVPASRTLKVAVLAVLVAGAGYALSVAVRVDAVHDHPLTRRVGQSTDVAVRVTDDPRPAVGHRVVLRGDLVAVSGQTSGGSVTVFGSEQAVGRLAVGDTARFRAAVRAPQRRDLSVATLTVSGPLETAPPSQILHWANTIRDRLAGTAAGALPEDEAALLPALVVGDTSTLDTAVVEQFRDSGLTHLMAVSGANVSIVCGAALLLGRLAGPRVGVGFAAVVLVGFVLVVRPSPSVLRAALMGGIGLLAVLTSRRRQAIPALAATILVLLAVVPRLAVDIGFALSVVATAALVVLAPRWSGKLVDRGWPRPLAGAVCISVAAQLVTAPLIAAISGRFSLASVAANLLAGLVIAPITILGTLAAAVVAVSPSAAGILIRFCGPELWWLLRVAEAGASGGATVLPVPSGLCGAVAVGIAMVTATLLWRRRWFRLVIGGSALVVLALVISGVLVD